MAEWQGYIDDSLIGSGHMHSAALLGKADGSYWAYGGDYIPQPEEVAHILKIVKDPQSAFASGVTIATIKFFVVRAEPGNIIFKKGGAGGCIATSDQGIVMGVYGNPDTENAALSKEVQVNPADCNTTVVGIAKYLKENGY